MAVSEPGIPEDGHLEELDQQQLRTLAKEYNVPGRRSKSKKDLRRQLRVRRDHGGIALRCPNNGCGREWIYSGDAEFRTSCPHCTGSVRIRPNRIYENE